MFLSRRQRKCNQPDIRTIEGFTKLYETYLEYVYSICFRYLQDKSESEDITSKIFTSLWERREVLSKEIEIDNHNAWNRYLAKAVRLSIYNYCRNQEIANNHLSSAVRELCSYDHTTENELALEELSEQLSILVNQLPPKCKHVFQLSRNSGLSNKEIAQRLCISDHAVKKHIAKALNYLRENLADYSVPKRATGT